MISAIHRIECKSLLGESSSSESHFRVRFPNALMFHVAIRRFLSNCFEGILLSKSDFRSSRFSFTSSGGCSCIEFIPQYNTIYIYLQLLVKQVIQKARAACEISKVVVSECL